MVGEHVSGSSPISTAEALKEEREKNLRRAVEGLLHWSQTRTGDRYSARDSEELRDSCATIEASINEGAGAGFAVSLAIGVGTTISNKSGLPTYNIHKQGIARGVSSNEPLRLVDSLELSAFEYVGLLDDVGAEKIYAGNGVVYVEVSELAQALAQDSELTIVYHEADVPGTEIAA